MFKVLEGRKGMGMVLEGIGRVLERVGKVDNMSRREKGRIETVNRKETEV